MEMTNTQIRKDGNPSRANIKQALVGFNSLVHSFCALSTLRRSGLRTASTSAKPCQGDSLEFYLVHEKDSVTPSIVQFSIARSDEYVAWIRRKLIQKLLLNQKCMGYLVRAYYSISPIRYYKDDSWWSAYLKSKATKDIISIGNFMEVLVHNHYVFTTRFNDSLFITYLFLRFVVHESLDVVSVIGEIVAVNSSETVLSEDETFLWDLVG
ncbi:hypothetical protein Tco_1182853 [Tanacetum coccineum]